MEKSYNKEEMSAESSTHVSEVQPGDPEIQVMEKSSEIKEQVMDIISFCLKRDNSIKRRDSMDEYKQLCMVTFTNFHQKYPTLFFSIIENPSSFPLYRLDELLNLKQKIENNELNEGRASAHLGQKYYNEFVKDTVSELDKNLSDGKSRNVKVNQLRDIFNKDREGGK